MISVFSQFFSKLINILLVFEGVQILQLFIEGIAFLLQCFSRHVRLFVLI